MKKYSDIYNELLIWIKNTTTKDIYGFYFHILYKYNGYQKFISRIGEDAIDHIEELLSLTLNYSQLQQSYKLEDLHLFLQYVKEHSKDIKRENIKENKINLMTVHSSKGLESKIVFLLNDYSKAPNNSFIKDDTENIIFFTSQYNHKYINNLKETHQKLNNDEEKRLFYVAITRAKEQLYICSLGKKNTTSIWGENIVEINNNNKMTKINDDIFNNYSYFCNNDKFIISNFKKTINHSPTRNTHKILDSFPKWYSENLVPIAYNIDTSFISPSNFTKKLFTLNNASSSKKEKGIIIHKILENINKDNYTEYPKKYLNKLYLSSKDQTEILEHINNLLNHKEISKIILKKGQQELRIIGTIDNKVYSTRIDKIIIENNTIYIIDYKYSSYNGEVISAYKEQLNIYKKLIQNIYPTYNIKAFIIYLTNYTLVKT